MLKKIANVTAVISTSVMIIYFVFSWITFGGDISQKQMPLTDLPAIVILSLICAVGTVLIQNGNDGTMSRRESVIRIIIHILFLTAVVLTGGYILGWYVPSVSGVILMLLSIAFVYAVTFFSQYYNGKKTADEVNKKIRERMNEDRTE